MDSGTGVYFHHCIAVRVQVSNLVTSPAVLNHEYHRNGGAVNVSSCFHIKNCYNIIMLTWFPIGDLDRMPNDIQTEDPRCHL